MNIGVGVRKAAIMLAGILAGCVAGYSQPADAAASAPQSAASAPATIPSAAVKPHDDSFVIGIDDVLAINVWQNAELTKSIPVRSDGKISLPLVGEIQAAGRTPLQLEGDITERLKSYLTSPEVTVMVQEIKSQNFNVLGMVAKPGSYSLTVASTLMDAIATAGGFKDFAKETRIYILRAAADGSQKRIDFNYKDFIKGKNLDKNKNVRLEPHDTIVVP